MWYIIYDLSKKNQKNRGAQKHSNEPRTNPPSGVSKYREFYLACTGGVETKKNAGPNKEQYVRDELQKSPWSGI